MNSKQQWAFAALFLFVFVVGWFMPDVAEMMGLSRMVGIPMGFGFGLLVGCVFSPIIRDLE